MYLAATLPPRTTAKRMMKKSKKSKKGKSPKTYNDVRYPLVTGYCISKYGILIGYFS